MEEKKKLLPKKPFLYVLKVLAFLSVNVLIKTFKKRLYMKGKIKGNATYFTHFFFFFQQYKETAKVLYQSTNTRYRFKPPKLVTKN